MLLFIDEFVFLEPCKRSYLPAEYSLKFLQHILLILYQVFLSVAGTSRPPAIAWPSCLLLAFSFKCISPSMTDYQYQHWSMTSPLRSSLHCAMYVGRHTNCLSGGKKSSVVFAWESGRVSMPLLGGVGGGGGGGGEKKFNAGLQGDLNFLDFGKPEQSYFVTAIST